MLMMARYYGKSQVLLLLSALPLFTLAPQPPALAQSSAELSLQPADGGADESGQSETDRAAAKPSHAEAVASARELSFAFRNAADKAMPSVVKILAQTRDEDSDENPILSILGGEDQQVFDSVGSGVIVSPDGTILTNHHVIRNSVRTEVRLTDGRSYRVVDTKSDPRSDLAIIKIESERELPVAELGSSRDLYVGEWVLAIGSPFMLESSVSAGIISGTRRSQNLRNNVVGQFIQTDASVNPGNSGGPLVNLDGKVVGINTAIASRTGSFQGIGFAIPIDRAKWIQRELVEYGEVRRGYIGVRTSDLPFDVADELELSSARGAIVNSVVPDRPAQLAGLRSGDIIVEFDGQIVESAADFASLVQQSPIGAPLPLIILRGGERKELSVTLDELRR